MSNSLAPPEPMVLRPEDFDPPLKRNEATVPYYWTVDEIAAEIGSGTRIVTYDITGRPERKVEPNLKAFKVAKVFLVPEQDALEYIKRHRERKKS